MTETGRDVVGLRELHAQLGRSGLAVFDGGIGHVGCDCPCLFEEVAFPSRAAAIVGIVNALPTLLAVVEAAQELSHFLEHEKETTAPPDELLSENCIACESSADYDREEKLSEALALKLEGLHSQASDEGNDG